MFFIHIWQIEIVKKVKEITKTSILDMIDYLMAGAGINKEQALVAMDAIVHYVQAHPGEKLNRMLNQLLRGKNDRSEAMN
jgi:hypothetical protein